MKKIITVTTALGLALCLCACSLVLRQQQGVVEPELVVIEAVVQRADIATVYHGSGTLKNQQPIEVEIPAGVELLGYTIKNGETVKKGDIIAKADKNSVLMAIANTTDKLAAHDAKLSKAKDEAVEQYITSAAGGRVKQIFASAGDDIPTVMQNHQALMVISLDGCMKGSIKTDAAFSTGLQLVAKTAAATTHKAKVQSCRDGILTFTLSDELVSVGESVELFTQDEQYLGTAIMEVSSPLNISGFWGTVDAVLVRLNDKINPNTRLLSLSDRAYTAQYSLLLNERDELLTQLSALNQLLNDGYCRASADGMITDIPTGESYIQLSHDSSNAKASTLSASTQSASTQSANNLSATKLSSRVTKDDVPAPTPAPPQEGGSATPLPSIPSGWGDFGGWGGFGGFSGFSGFALPTPTPEPVIEPVNNIICSIIPQDSMTIELSVDERDILGLSVGQSANVTLDALKGTHFSSTVKDIATQGSSMGGGAKFLVTVELKRTPQMLDGMNASVQIELGRASKVLTVPAAAILEQGNTQLIYTGYDIKNDELTNPVAVTTGVSDGSLVELLSGLNEGDSFFYRWSDKLVYRVK